MNTKHTPGPWSAYYYDPNMDPGNGPSNMPEWVICTKDGRIPPIIANARLIAVAPEMHELLLITKSYLNEIQCLHKKIKESGVMTDRGVMTNANGLIAAIESIVAKTRGEEARSTG